MKDRPEVYDYCYEKVCENSILKYDPNFGIDDIQSKKHLMKNNKRYISILESIKNNGNLEDGTKNDKVLIIDASNTFIRVFKCY